MSEHSSKEQIAKIIRDLRDIAKYSNIPVPINIAADCIAALERQASLHNDQCATFEARIVELERENADHEEVHADHRRLVRELDILLNGEAGAAKQASLCDIVAQVAQQKRAAHEPKAPPTTEQLIALGDAFVLPCDVRVGAGTVKRGVKVGTLLRMISNHMQYSKEAGYPFTDGYLDRKPSETGDHQQPIVVRCSFCNVELPSGQIIHQCDSSNTGDHHGT